ncbi:MAG: 16S rRNA processing protein RimM [Clostridiales bacterium]|jgi:16S rRNA processing protein RimM|nr:16S rRNA processing protein RimM [Clostridiales bacterium]
MGKEKIVIGEILKPQGIRGELKVLPITEDIERFHILKEVYVGSEPKKRRVRGCRTLSGFAYLYLDGVLTRNDAEKLRGQLLSVDRKDAIPLKENEYFIADIIGCDIFDEEGVFLGTVKNVLKSGAADIFEAERDGKGFMFPFIEGIAEVFVEAKKITVDSKRFKEVVCYED